MNRRFKERKKIFFISFLLELSEFSECYLLVIRILLELSVLVFIYCGIYRCNDINMLFILYLYIFYLNFLI